MQPIAIKKFLPSPMCTCYNGRLVNINNTSEIIYGVGSWVFKKKKLF